MRILLVSNLYPPYWLGGYELLASWVVDGLRARGHDVHVLTGRGPAFADRPEIVGTLDLDLPALQAAHFAGGIAFGGGLPGAVARHVFSRANLRAAARAIDDVGPELVSFWNPAFITWSPLLAARRKGVPSVVHLSDTAVNPFRNPHPPAFPALLRPLARRAVDHTLARARPRRLVLPSQFLREKFARTERLPSVPTEVLPWPVPPALEGAALGPRPSAHRLLFVGSLAPEKGAALLLDALRSARAQRPELTLTLVGDAGASAVAALRAAAADLPVRFCGRLPHAQVLEEYARHDVLVFPSTWDEPFAVVPLEAMAAGLTVVATRAGGTPEAVEDGETGLLVPPGDGAALAQALASLAADPPRARRLAAAGHQRAHARFGFALFMARLEGLYAQATAANGGGQ